MSRRRVFGGSGRLEDMNDAGRNISAVRPRKKGECPTCGTKLYKMGLLGKKKALTIAGRVRNGRCLQCNPENVATFGNSDVVGGGGNAAIINRRRPEAASTGTDPHPVPPDITIKRRPNNHYNGCVPDDSTIISGITLDHRFANPDDDDDDDDDAYAGGGEAIIHEETGECSGHSGGDFVMPMRLRPDASDDELDEQPELPKRSLRPIRQLGQDPSSSSSETGADGPPRSLLGPKGMSAETSSTAPMEHSHSSSAGPLSNGDLDVDGTERDVEEEGGPTQLPFPSNGSAATPVAGTTSRHRARDDHEQEMPTPAGNSRSTYTTYQSGVANAAVAAIVRDNLLEAAAAAAITAPEEGEKEVEAATPPSLEQSAHPEEEECKSASEPVSAEAAAAPPLSSSSCRTKRFGSNKAPGSPVRRWRRSLLDDDDGDGGNDSTEIHPGPSESLPSSATRAPSFSKLLKIGPMLRRTVTGGSRSSSDSGPSPQPEPLPQPSAALHSQPQPGMRVAVSDDEGAEEEKQEEEAADDDTRSSPIQAEVTLAWAAGPSVTEAEILCLVRDLEQARRGRDLEAQQLSLQSLSSAVWALGGTGKRKLVDSQGVDILVDTMWDSMNDADTELAAAHLMLALVTSDDAEPEGDVVAGDLLDRAIDALLFVMQALKLHEKIQQVGCRVLGCLASASSNNTDVNDGTVSGAVRVVLTAMSSHRGSHRVQLWGLRALYNQCVHSRNAEGNKRAVASESLDGDSANGAELVLRCLTRATSDPVMTEWAYRLYRWLTESDDVAEMLSPAGDLIAGMARTVRALGGSRLDRDVPLEACLGIIANFSKIESNRRSMDVEDIALLALEMMEAHKDCPGIVVECCCIVSNLAADLDERDALVEAGAVRNLLRVNANAAAPNDTALAEVALKALAALSKDCDRVKAVFCEKDTFAIFLGLFETHQKSAQWQEAACRLLSSVYQYMSSAVSWEAALANDSLPALLSAMKLHAEAERVQEAACLALRSLAHKEADLDRLVRGEGLSLVLEAMRRYEQSKSIQFNACSILWNASSKLETDDANLADAVDRIAMAIRNHIDSCEVLEMACGALWCLVHGSDELKERLLGVDCGIDSISSALIMHQSTPSLVGKACGVLSSLSANERLAVAVAAAQGVENIVDAMRNNGSSVALLELGALFLKNTIAALPHCAAEASGAMTVVVQAIKDNPGNVGLQREACNFLWALAVYSDEGKSRLLALDGIAVLMDVLEHCGDDDSARDAALGAFNELALTSPGGCSNAAR